MITHHTLADPDVPPMSNKSTILSPRCANCGYIIQLSDVATNIKKDQKVLLITGTAGSGKTALGQLIERSSDYLFIDGDAVQKRVHHLARRDPGVTTDCQAETIRTMLIALGLGYNVAVGYIIVGDTLAQYTQELAVFGITPTFRVLVPERSVCLQRDAARDCWTAGERWVDQWYDEMRGYLITHPECCIDSSAETLDQTFVRHIKPLL